MDYKTFLDEFNEYNEWDLRNKCEIVFDENDEARIECHPREDATDMVNSPSHYTQGTQEAIDIIEEAIANAPGPITGMLQAQVLKYLLRLWNKENPAQDAKKAQWYLTRLIAKLDGE